MQSDASRHKRRVRLLALLLGSAIACGGCYTLEQAVPPVADLVGPGDRATASLNRGRVIYITACAKCHSPTPVRAYTKDRWTELIIPKMAGITKLSADDTAALRSYVLAVLKEDGKD